MVSRESRETEALNVYSELCKRHLFLMLILLRSKPELRDRCCCSVRRVLGSSFSGQVTNNLFFFDHEFHPLETICRRGFLSSDFSRVMRGGETEDRSSNSPLRAGSKAGSGEKCPSASGASV